MKNILDRLMVIVEKINPKLSKFTKNKWISGLQTAVMRIVPLTILSTIVTIYDVVREWIPSLPGMESLSTYTFGIAGLVVAMLVPFYIVEKISNEKKMMAMITSVGVYIMLMKPEVTEAGVLFDFSWFGASGMLVAIVVGFLVAIVFNLFKNFNVFDEDSGMPDFVKEWFDTIIPMFVVFFFGWVITELCHAQVFAFLSNILNPILSTLGNSLGGVMALEFIQIFIYTFGISGWVIYPALSLVIWPALDANIQAWHAGLPLPFVYAGALGNAYNGAGGTGNTLPLNIYMLFSKNKRLKKWGNYLLYQVS